MRAAPWLSLAMVLLLAGCATVWQPVQGRLETATWSIQVPDGWVRLTTPGYEMLSKDGPYLQYILIQETPIDKGFRYTRRVVTQDMLPHEMAGVVMDNLRADPQIMDLVLAENAPAMIGGQPGFKLVYSYQDRQGVAMRTIYYGTTNGARFFNLRYTATERHYFAVDRDAFEQVAKSLHLSLTP